ncbi:MAG: HTH domain-containing protein [Planctomycetaceae bacterium]|nr:HTH domain-containing protein [Planctomycetaceae bacterium]
MARVLDSIQGGCYSTPGLAAALDVSMPTISRYIHALRRRGHPIRAVRHGGRWCYKVASDIQNSPSGHGGR